MKKIYLILISFLLAFNLQAQVVINEVYGGGGNSGATYTHDFVELYNNGTTAVSLTGWSVQYASAAGTSWTITNLTGSIPAKGYFLIQMAAGTGGTTALPTPDFIGSTAMSGTSGKVALVNTTTSLSGTCPLAATYVDFVGFGAANCFEGTGAVPALTNATSAQRSTVGLDTDDNLLDFTRAAPTPVNGAGPDVTAPLVSALNPANGTTGLGTAFVAKIKFNEKIIKGSAGNILIKKSADNSTILSLDVTGASVFTSNDTASISVSGLSLLTQYYFEIPAGAFTDLAGNSFAGISDATTWSFTTGNNIAAGSIGTTYGFTNCTGIITEGFSQFSKVGSQTWACTTFGRDPNAPAGTAAYPYAVQINGYDNGVASNVPNEDWLISPAYDLSGTNFPLLSFWSRTAFNGLPLQLKASTNYSGTGDPTLATWTDVNGRFPNQTSNIWTLSDSINLTAYKSTATYFAFVYTSSDDEGARWTLDDITVFNSLQAPVGNLATNTNSLEFGFVAAATNSVKTFTLAASDVTAAVNLTTSGAYLISKTNGSFTSSISFTQAEINNTNQTIYVQFSPVAINTNYTSNITISSAGLNTLNVALKGNSLDEANTLEVVNWNIEWFGSAAQAPTNDALQLANVTTIAKSIKADIFAFSEIVSETNLQALVASLNTAFGANTYAYNISNFGSHTNPFESNPGNLADAQKLAFVYKTSVISPIGQPVALVTNGVNTAADLNNPAFNYFSSGRYPYMMRANVTLGTETKEIRFILLHGKANTSPIATSYNRRKAGADTLAYTLNNLYPNDNIILLGDFNDDLDQSVAAGFTTTSYSAFTTNSAAFFAPTLALSLAGKKSTVAYNDMIDHVMLSNEMQRLYINSSASVLDDVSSLVSNYGTTTTDHYPIFTRYAFDAAILPITLLDFSVKKNAQSVTINWRTANENNSKAFLVQRSTDNGVHWETIKTLAAAGNSQSTLVYNCVDYSPAKGLNLYRLKSVDVDDRFSLSASKPAFFAENVQVSVWPNPTASEVNIQFAGSDVSNKKIILFDNNGRQLKKFNSMANQFKIDVSGLNKGIYILHIISASGETREKLIVQ